jgi:hypothetical protein
MPTTLVASNANRLCVFDVLARLERRETSGRAIFGAVVLMMRDDSRLPTIVGIRAGPSGRVSTAPICWNGTDPRCGLSKLSVWWLGKELERIKPGNPQRQNGRHELMHLPPKIGDHQAGRQGQVG